MKKKLLIIIAMMLLVVGCANENKKENVSKDNNSPKETVTDTNKKDDTTDTNKEEKTDTSKEENADTKKEENGTNTQPTNEVVDNTQTSSPAPAPTPTCTPKKFNGTYSYAYSTMEECKREGNNLFMEKYQSSDDNKKDTNKKIGKMASKAAADYFTGGKGGKIVDKLANTKLGGAAMQKMGDSFVKKNPGIGKIANKLNESGILDLADKAGDLNNKKLEDNQINNATTDKTESPDNHENSDLSNDSKGILPNLSNKILKNPFCLLKKSKTIIQNM